MTNQEIVNLFEALNGINLKGVKFNYSVSKNIELLKKEINSFKESTKPSEEFAKYEKERTNLCVKHAEKDGKGKPIIENNEYKITNIEEFEKEIAELKEKNKEAIEARQAQLKEFEEFLTKENTITLFKIKVADIPADITTKQLTSIISLIEE